MDRTTAQPDLHAPMSRRSFAKGLGVSALAAGLGVTGGRAVAQTLGGGSSVLEGRIEGSSLSSASVQPAITGVDLSNHPAPGVDSDEYPIESFPTLGAVIDFDQSWLDQQATAYWQDYAQHLGRPLNDYDQADFWFRYIAIPLQHKAMLGQSLEAGSIEKDLALIHLVGYYGGLWFFKKLEEFIANGDPTARCENPTADVTDDRFAPMASTLHAAINAARVGGDAAALEFAENALRGGDLVFYLSNGLPTLNGLIGGYAYNVGYTNAILVPDNRALPPPANPAGPSLFHPPWNSFEFTPNGVFDATYPTWADAATATTHPAIPPDPNGFTPVPYLIGDVPAMEIARGKFAEAQENHFPGFLRVREGLVDRNGNPVARGDLSVLAQAAFNTGTATWTAPGLLDIRGWDEPSYHLIVALSIFFVQAMQSAGQACMAAAASENADDARDAIMDTAVALPFGLSYLIGSGQRTNEHYACRTADECVPPFTFATP